MSGTKDTAKGKTGTMWRSACLAVSVLLILVNSLGAQTFGKNKVQYHVFDWSFIQSPHFDIYFYAGGQPLAEFTSEVAEEAYKQISRVLNWDLRKRVSILVYQSHNDFQQTNVIYDFMPEGVGGVTELFKNRVVVPFEGSYEQLRHVVHHELVHAMINDMIYGGSAQSLVSNRVRVRIPLWMNEGLAEYLSLRWETQADMIMRDLAVHDRIPGIRELEYYMAYKGGQSVWRFIAETYGWQKIGEILGQTKMKQDVEKAFRKAIGMDFKELSKKWQRYLKKEYWPDVAGRDELDDFAHRLTDHEELRNYFNISPAVSPDGSRIAILTDRTGYADIYLISAIDGKVIKKLVKGNRTPAFEELKWLQPGISWSPDSKKIAFAAKAGESDALYLLDAKTGKREKLTFNLNGIFTAAWSPDGEEIAFVGNHTNASDIYVYNLKKKSLEKLTDDVFSDSEPSWSPDGTKIAFVSDRAGMSETPPNFDMHRHDYQQTDIYVVDRKTREIERITNTPYNESYPVWAHTSNAMAYTSDRKGVWNLYLHDLDSHETKAISNVLTGIFQLSWSHDDQKLIFSAYSGTGWDIYSLTNPLDLAERDVTESNFVQKYRREGSEDLAAFTEGEGGERPKAFEYSETAFSRYIFAPEYRHYNQQLVDTTEQKPVEPLAVAEYKNPDGSYRSHPYKTRFTLDLVNGQASFSNVFGYLGTTLFVFSDILGDHRIFVGTELVISPENSDYFFRYDYLRRRNDYSLSLFHTANFFSVNPVDFIRLRHYSLDLSISRPFSRFQRLEFGMTDHFINYRFYVQQYSGGYEKYGIAEDVSLRALTYRLNWVYDNSSWGFTGPSDGWRANIQYLQSLNNYGDKLDFRTVLLDNRRYFRFYKIYSLAFRLLAGYSFGEDPQKFFLGGTENWILGIGETNGVRDASRINDDDLDIFSSDSTDYLKDLYFSIFVLPVRGSRFIERWGTKVVLTNSEFRFPFVNYLDLGFPLKLIFGNIRGVLFVDAGAAWDDKLNLTYQDPRTAQKEFKDLIVGYGFGLRINMGYFILRIDTAWDYQLKGSSRPQYYLSLGTDI